MSFFPRLLSKKARKLLRDPEKTEKLINAIKSDKKETFNNSEITVRKVGQGQSNY